LIWGRFRRKPAATPPDGASLVQEGAARAQAGRLAEAEAKLREAVEAAPDLAVAHVQLGVVLARMGRVDEALACFQRGVELAPGDAYAQMNLANVYRRFGQLDRALAHYRQAVKAAPGLTLAWSNMLRPMMDAGDWDGAHAGLEAIRAERDGGDARGRHRSRHEWGRYVTPMDSLLLPMSAGERRAVADFHASRLAVNTAPLHRPRDRGDGRLRIGYLSRDFRHHAVGQLARALFLGHDRARFEIIAYSCGRDDGSAYRRAAETETDRFVDAQAMTLDALAQRIADDGVDILVDLGGYTSDHRLGVLARRPAPVQAHYLGYPATLGAGLADYYVSDTVASPADHDAQFAEKLVRLPPTFMASDPDMPIATAPAPRAAWSIPDDAVVLCAFHQTAKVHRAVLDAWFAILRAVPGSLLWLKAPGAEPERRFGEAASRAGLDPARLVFAPNVAGKTDHLARMAAADLFLDTFERYGGHSTVNEALWCGVPAVSVAGDRLAARVAASLLHAAGVPELAVNGVDAYVALASRLASDSAARGAYRERLVAARATAPLFSANATVRALEAAYDAMWARHAAGLTPAAIDLR